MPQTRRLRAVFFIGQLKMYDISEDIVKSLFYHYFTFTFLGGYKWKVSIIQDGYWKIQSTVSKGLRKEEDLIVRKP